jgi:KaiC/GvpD/RAD55 family RecA-like ATPase
MFSLSFVSEAKEQVLANLANFAYDPINYEFLRKLNVIDLFLDQLSEENTNFVRIGLGGLCNLALGNCASVYVLVLKFEL